MKSIIVNIVPEETRIAIVEDQELSEISVERTENEYLVGNIYKGRVQNVLPGMQAAFVDIGQAKNAFLYIGDGLPKEAARAIVKNEAIHVGQNVLIQVVKDAIDAKGPRATTHLSIPGRYVVLMPTVDYIGISRRIEQYKERGRLKKIASEICPRGMGLIVRTAAEGKPEDVLKKDVEYLGNLWRLIMARFKVSHSPTLLYRDADLMVRIVRDYFTAEIDSLVVDRRDAYLRVLDMLEFISPDLIARVKLYKGDAHIFQAYHLNEEIEKLSRREVILKSGGFLVIDKTEALTVIDVNTGKFVGRTNLADTVYQANLEAAEEIMRQIRLRDIGGIIIVDFIDMETEEQKHCVLRLLEEKAKLDKTKTNIVDITPLGLVEITRKKSRRNFEGTMYGKCPYCGGRGLVKSPETVAINIGRELRTMAKRNRPARGYVVQVHAQVADAFARLRLLHALEKELACKIRVEKVGGMHPEGYSVLRASASDD